MFEIDLLLFWLLCCSFIRDPSSIEGKIIYLATDDIINTAGFFRFNNNIIWSQSSSASWFISQRVWNWSCLMKIYCILILIFLLNPIQKEKIFRELFIGAFLFFLNRKFTTMIRSRMKFDVFLVSNTYKLVVVQFSQYLNLNIFLHLQVTFNIYLIFPC